MRKSLQLQAELGPGVRRHPRLRGRRAGRRRERARARWSPNCCCRAENRFGRVGARRAPGRPPGVRRRRRDASSARRRAPGLPDGAQAARRGRRRARGRAIDAATPAGHKRPMPRSTALIETHGALRDVVSRSPRCRASQSLSFGLMDFVSAHRGAIPASAMSAPGPVRAPAGGARQARDRRGLPRRTARCRRTAWSPSSSTPSRAAGPRPHGPRASSATRACGASTRRRSSRSSRPSRRAWPRSTRRSRSSCAAQAAHWAPIRHRDTAARPRQLPLLLAGARARAPHV